MKTALVLCLAFAVLGANAWNAGVGIGDVTGPAAEILMMGYAHPGQVSAGIHTRQYARAYVFEDESGERGVFVSIDMGMMGHLLKYYVIEALAEQGYGSVYKYENVILSGTHTHNGPEGYLQYVLLQISGKGFVDQNFEGLIEGITLAIRNADANLKPARLFYSQGMLDNANINRSPSSYEANPEAEREEYGSYTDQTVSQLNIFDASDDSPMGLINWFAVHPTSVNNTNHMISSDNKGRAGERFEKYMNPNDLMGQGSFVAAFASANLGDVSPNTAGPMCVDTGEPCDYVSSTCEGHNQMCYAQGPGEDMYDSCKIIGDRQFEKAKELFEDTANHQEVSDGLATAFEFIDMTNQHVEVDGIQVKTCLPAMGWSFAAGTTDGPGAFTFIQGMNESNSIIMDQVIEFLKEPSEEQNACHAPKPILLDTGEATQPHAWHPTIVDTQMMKLGDLFIAAMPGEMTTMSGRRMRKSVLEFAVGLGADASKAHVIIAGLSGLYTHYITTFEEYQRQRYEAASCIYGPHALQAYQQQYEKLTTTMMLDLALAPGTPPDNLYEHQLSLILDVTPDRAPAGTNFGDCLVAPEDKVPGQSAEALFVSGNLRNHLMHEDTFLTVEQKQSDDTWKVVYRDTDFETMMQWERTDSTADWSESQVKILWNIPETRELGTYRIAHKGWQKTPTSGIAEYSGVCPEFEVKAVASRW